MNASNIRANPGIPELNYATAGEAFAAGSSLKSGPQRKGFDFENEFQFQLQG
jgi:hypothetical protein